MKKLLSVIAITIITASSLKAQSSTSSTTSSKPVMFSIGVEPSLPIGKFNDAGYKFGIGGSLQGEFKVANDLGLTLKAGYEHFSGKDFTIGGDVTVKGADISFVPVMAGAKFYATPMFYIHGQLGAAIGTSKSSDAVGSSTYFAYSPGVGFMVSKNFDISVNFTGMSKNSTSLNTIGARVAYAF